VSDDRWQEWQIVLTEFEAQMHGRSFVMSHGQARMLQDLSIMAGELLVWTVYAHPTDHPKKMVARPFSTRLSRPVAVVMLADTLDALRDNLPFGLTRLNRDETDDPVIVESWI
jgi:hypothetical protein